jgi:hypothetical protein
MIPIKTKKSPCTQLGGTDAGGSETKTGLLYVLFTPARRGTTFYGPFSFEIIARQEGFINE